jgi:hypothetical protein
MSGAIEFHSLSSTSLVSFSLLLPLAIALSVLLLARFCFVMARVKSTTCVSSGEDHVEATDTTSQLVVEVLSSMNRGSLYVVGLLSHEGSEADTSDSDADSGSNNSSDDISESELDSTKKVELDGASVYSELGAP